MKREHNYFQLLSATGRTVSMGYLKQEAKTKEVFDENYFFCSCDFVNMDEEGFMTISGRSIGSVAIKLLSYI